LFHDSIVQAFLQGIMAAPKYLTGDAAGIKEFLDKFDVSDLDCALDDIPLTLHKRCFSLTAMVRKRRTRTL
jgi:hypothetical protein